MTPKSRYSGQGKSDTVFGSPNFDNRLPEFPIKHPEIAILADLKIRYTIMDPPLQGPISSALGRMVAYLQIWIQFIRK